MPNEQEVQAWRDAIEAYHRFQRETGGEDMQLVETREDDK